MNFDVIHLKYEKAPTVCCIIFMIIVSLIISALFTFMTLRSLDGIILLPILSGMVAILIPIFVAVDIPYFIRQHKDGDIYGFYIGANDEHIKRITKEEYDFIQSVKNDYILGETIKEEDINKIREIIKR